MSKMPIYCCNRIVIEGELSELKNDLGEDFENMFSKTIPRPLRFEENEFYDYWSTKWDPCEIEIITNIPNKIEIKCDTAWSPPINWAKKCCEKYKTIRIKIYYCEIGMGFYGKFNVNSNGGGDVRYKLNEAELIYNEDDGDDEEELYVLTGHIKKFIEKNRIGLGG